MLLLHGIGLSADCFIRNIDSLAREFAVIAPDLLGHGFTDSDDFGREPPQIVMAHHIMQLADHLELETYNIIGSSFGAHVAAHVYLAQPARVEKLVLVGSGSVFHSSAEQKRTLEAALANGRRAMMDPTIEACRERLAAIVFDPDSIPPELPAIQLTSYARSDRLTAYEAAVHGSILTMDDPGARVLPRLEQIACPTLVIVGRDDIRADWQVHLEGAARMPNARVSVYHRCGHLPFLEYPERFNREVRDFLTEGSSE